MEDFDWECIFDDDYLKKHFSFLFNEEYGFTENNIKNTTYGLSVLQNESITYQPSRMSTDVSLTWSSNSSGSLSSAKEEPSEFINIVTKGAKTFLYQQYMEKAAPLQEINPFSVKMMNKSSEMNDDLKPDPFQLDSFVTELTAAQTSTPKKRLDFGNSSKTANKENEDPTSDNATLDAIYCKFCFRNGEPLIVYKSHVVKKVDGTVVCPILRKYVCTLCGATGDRAHTKKYCPFNFETEISKPLYRRLSNGTVVSNNKHK